MRIIKTFAVLLIFATAVCGQNNSGVEVTPGNEGLTVEYIANEGISITHGKHRILLDAIHRQYKPAYAFTPEDILSKIESARYPYGNTSLILVSHNHLDHFHAESIARHLMNNNNAVLVSSDQVVDEVEKSGAELKKLFPRRSAKPEQFRRIKHEWKRSEVLEQEGLKITFLGLKHANSELPKFRDVQNLGHLIEIGGKKLLHIGDADMLAENFDSFGLEDQVIDVAFIPYWFLLSKDGKALLKKDLRAKTIVAVHVPPSNQSKTIRDILVSMPSAVVFTQKGEMLNY